MSVCNQSFEEEDDYLLDIKDVATGQLIGQGQFATVYLGKYFGEYVAVKKQVRDAKVLETYLIREIALLQKAKHANLISFFGAYNEVNEDGQQHALYLVTEYCQGGDLLEMLCHDPQELGWKFRVRIALQAASAINYLHQNNFIHRDIKSSNLLIDQDWQCKICDFGMAVEINPKVGRKMTLCGTAEYMAPELMFDEDSYSFEIDIFSFGMVLLEILKRGRVGRAGFGERSPSTKFRLEELALREMLPPDSPHSLVALALQCVSDDPSFRPASGDVIEWLQDLHDNSPDDVIPLPVLATFVDNFSDAAPFCEDEESKDESDAHCWREIVPENEGTGGAGVGVSAAVMALLEGEAGAVEGVDTAPMEEPEPDSSIVSERVTGEAQGQSQGEGQGVVAAEREGEVSVVASLTHDTIADPNPAPSSPDRTAAVSSYITPLNDTNTTLSPPQSELEDNEGVFRLVSSPDEEIKVQVVQVQQVHAEGNSDKYAVLGADTTDISDSSSFDACRLSLTDCAVSSPSDEMSSSQSSSAMFSPIGGGGGSGSECAGSGPPVEASGISESKKVISRFTSEKVSVLRGQSVFNKSLSATHNEISYCGILFKKNSRGFFRNWKKVYVTISGCNLRWASAANIYSKSYSLKGAVVSMTMQFRFQISNMTEIREISGTSTREGIAKKVAVREFAAESAKEMQDWISKLNLAIAQANTFGANVSKKISFSAAAKSQKEKEQLGDSTETLSTIPQFESEGQSDCDTGKKYSSPRSPPSIVSHSSVSPRNSTASVNTIASSIATSVTHLSAIIDTSANSNGSPSTSAGRISAISPITSASTIITIESSVNINASSVNINARSATVSPRTSASCISTVSPDADTLAYYSSETKANVTKYRYFGADLTIFTVVATWKGYRSSMSMQYSDFKRLNDMLVRDLSGSPALLKGLPCFPDEAVFQSDIAGLQEWGAKSGNVNLSELSHSERHSRGYHKLQILNGYMVAALGVVEGTPHLQLFLNVLEVFPN